MRDGGGRAEAAACPAYKGNWGAGCGARAIDSGVDLRDVGNHTLLAGRAGAPPLHAIASGGGGRHAAATHPGGVTGADGGGTAPRQATRTPAGERLPGRQ